MKAGNGVVSPNHKKFIKHYVATGKQTEAYRKAFPANKNPDVAAAMLVAKPHIQDAIQQAFAKYDRGIDKDIGGLIEVADNQDAKITGSDKLRATELLLKLRGAFNQPNLNLNFSITGKIEDMQEGEARELLEKIRAKNSAVL